MNVIHQNTVKLNPPGGISEIKKQNKRVCCKKTHPDVAVDDEAEAEQTIKERGGRARGHEGSASERDEAGGKQTLESPVVGSV